MEVSGIVGEGQTPEHYEVILENIHDAVYTLDPDGYITWVNQVAFDEFDIGYTREELIGAHVSKVLSDEDIEKCAEIIGNLYENDGRVRGECEITLQTSYGGEIPCDLRITLLHTAEEAFSGTIGVLRDITDRKRREEGLMVLNRVLRHNLRNRLNVILGRANLLQNKIDDDDRHLHKIMESAYELERLGDKARRGGEVLTAENWTIEVIDMVEVLENISDEIRQRYPNCRINLDLPAAVPVLAEPTVSIAISNILENAAKYSDPGEAKVDIWINTDERDWVEIMIADNGPGIPSSEIQSIMSGEETPLVHGSGLGLWICKWVAERCGGQFEIVNDRDRGTIVELRLRRGGT